MKIVTSVWELSSVWPLASHDAVVKMSFERSHDACVLSVFGCVDRFNTFIEGQPLWLFLYICSTTHYSLPLLKHLTPLYVSEPLLV